MKHDDILRGIVVRRLKISNFSGEYDMHGWFHVDKDSLKFYRVGKQARFRFDSSGITIDGLAGRIVGEDTLLPVTYAEIAAIQDDDRVDLPTMRSGWMHYPKMSRERLRELIKEFRARELDRDE